MKYRTSPSAFDARLKDFLEEKVSQFNRPAFIADDPVCIPHLFSLKQDREIAGFLAATLAWGQRKTIINKSKELLKYMDNAPYDFVLNHQEKDLSKLLSFKHRTFKDTDTLYFIAFFKHFYRNNQTLENAFIRGMEKDGENLEVGLINFHRLFFSLPDFPQRTKKHVATPERNSACKRINMFLRWMVRKDNNGVDFGLWQKIKPAQLICPCDLHVDKVARKLGLITRKQTDWKTALELTENLKKLDPRDPVKYDFALFGLGILDKF